MKLDIDLTWLEIVAKHDPKRAPETRLVQVAYRHEDPKTHRVVVIPKEPIRVPSRWGALGK